MPTRAGSKNKKTQAAKQNTQQYFAKLLTNAQEDLLWKRFTQSEDEDIAFRAFMRQVEYKRGKPVQPVAGGGEDGKFVVQFETVGANAEVLAAKARTLGLGS